MRVTPPQQLTHALQTLHASTDTHVEPAQTVLDAHSAVVAVQCAIADAVATATTASLPANFRTLSGRSLRLFGGAPQVSGDELLAAGAGFAATGRRVAVVLDASQAEAALGQMLSIVSQRAPLVVNIVPQSARGDEGDAIERLFHALEGSGWIQLFATNVQEVVDLSCVAHRLTAQLLIPVVVAYDGADGAIAVQDVSLPSRSRLRAYLPSSVSNAPGSTQSMLYGDHRNSIPANFDAHHARLQGAALDADVFAVVAASKRNYGPSNISAWLHDALSGWHALGGAKVSPVSYCASSATQPFGEATPVVEPGPRRPSRRWGILPTQQTAKSHSNKRTAGIALVCHGSVSEVCQRAAKQYNKHQVERDRVAVITVRQWRPQLGPELMQMLLLHQSIVVLERCDSALAQDGALMREIRCGLARCLDARADNAADPEGYPALRPEHYPRLQAAHFAGALGVRDINAVYAHLQGEFSTSAAKPIRLGVDLGAYASAYPKRQAVLDTVGSNFTALPEDSVSALAPERTALRSGTVMLGIAPAVGADELSLLGCVLRLVLGGSVRASTHNAPHSIGAAHGHVASIEVGDLEHLMGSLTSFEFLYMRGSHQGGPDMEAVQVNALRPGCVLLLGHDAPDVRTLPSTWQEILAAAPDSLLRAGGMNASTAIGGVPESQGDWACEIGTVLAAVTNRLGTDVSMRRLGAQMREAMGVSEQWIAQMQSGFENVQWQAESLPTAQAERSTSTPMAVRHLRRRAGYTGPDTNSSERFWNHTGVLFADGALDELRPEPFMSTSDVPSLTSSFHDWSRTGTSVPRFTPDTCDGCGKCWSACPEGAVAPAVMTPRALIEAAMARAKEQGAETDALRKVVAKLSKRATASLAKADVSGTRAGPWLRPAFDVLLAKTAETERDACAAAFEATVACIDDMAVARTEIFFDLPHAESSKAGELFTLAINPAACKGCGMCVTECAAGAMTLPQSEHSEPDSISHQQDGRDIALRNWQRWQWLPDTSGALIQRVTGEPGLGELAAAQLARGCLLSVVGGDMCEVGSGGRLAVRLALTSAEFVGQRRLQERIAQAAQLGAALLQSVSAQLSATLPQSDLDQLGQVLGSASESALQLDELLGRLYGGQEGRGLNGARTAAVDVPALSRLVNSAKQVEALHKALSEGPYGQGRSCYAVLLADGGAGSPLHRLTEYPRNPFSVPAQVAPARFASATAQGLLEGLQIVSAEESAILRRGTMLLERSTAAAVEEPRLDALSWAELSSEERQHAPPLMLLASDESFGQRELATLLRTGAPCKVIILSDPAAPLRQHGEPKDGRLTWLEARTLASARSDLFTAQTCIADERHFAQVMRGALHHPGLSVVFAYAPSAKRDSIATDSACELARLAVQARVTPLFMSGQDPTGADTSTESESADSTVERRTALYLWAWKQGTLAEHFLAADGLREGPSLFEAPDGVYEVSAALQNFASHIQERWQHLRELEAADGTGHSVLRESLHTELRGEFDRAMQHLKDSHTTALDAARLGFEADSISRLKQRLVQLAGQPKH